MLTKQQKHEQDMQRIREFRLFDDDFLKKCFEDHDECAELVLRIIMNKEDLKVLHSKTEYVIQNLQGRSVRLDVKATDSENKEYDIEVQRADKGAGRKRARHNSSMLDANALAPQDRQILFGQLYENGFLIKTADDKAPEVAVGWRERKLNGKYDFKWLYAGKFAEGISEEASTKEGKLSPTTKSIKGSFYERSLDNAYEISVDESNLVKENTKAAEAIKSWFSKVQEKNDAAA